LAPPVQLARIASAAPVGGVALDPAAGHLARAVLVDPVAEGRPVRDHRLVAKVDDRLLAAGAADGDQAPVGEVPPRRVEERRIVARCAERADDLGPAGVLATFA